jgi:hypothetical protein
MRLKYILIISILLISSKLFSQNEYSKLEKDFSFEYAVNKNSILNISNIYGDIVFTSTNDEKIVVTGVITSISRIENKAKKRLGEIMIYKKSDSNNISIKTMILKKNFTNYGEDRVNITYNIKVPVYLKMNIENINGDIIFENHNGKLNIDLLKGSLKAKSLVFPDSQPLPKIKTKFADVNIDYCNWVNIECSSSNINIDKSKSLIIKSDNSKLILDDCRIAYSNSTKDLYIFNNISKLDIKSIKTKLNINVLETSINCVGSEKSVNIKYIPSNFSNILIENKHGDVFLNIDENASYKVDCRSHYGSIEPPQKANINNYSTQEYQKIEGTVGKTKSNSNVKVITSYGKIVFQK